MPSEVVQLAMIALATSLLTGTVVVAVAAWAEGRRSRSAASATTAVAAQATTAAANAVEQTELARVRVEYRERIGALETRLDKKDEQIATLSKDLSDARVLVAQQAVQIANLEADLAQIHRERQAQIDALTVDTNQRLIRSEIGQGQRAVVAKEQGDRIEATGDDSNTRLRDIEEKLP